jgi:hypothetical protein
MIRVGRRVYNRDGTYQDPSYDHFTPIIVLTKSSQFGELGPYCLKTEDGCIFENYYQFSRLYLSIDKCDVPYSRYVSGVGYQYAGGDHVVDGKITPEYWKWRTTGMHWKSPVRYPCGFRNKNKGLCSLLKTDHGIKILGYVTSRKEIYLPLYSQLVRQQQQFTSLQQRVHNGENLLIIEVDGPHQESLPYYMETYHIDDSFIVNNTMLVNKENIQIMLNDTMYPFGHGYCLAMSLLDKQTEWCGGNPPHHDQMTVINDQTGDKYKIIKNSQGYCICQLGKNINATRFSHTDYALKEPWFPHFE